MVIQVASQEKLLKPNEVTACKKLAASVDSDSQRATALLAIHSGETQAIAAEASGLSLGQVRYILRRFRELRLSAFSSTKRRVTVQTQATTAAPAAIEQLEDKPKQEKPKKEKKPKKKVKSDKNKQPKKKAKPDKDKKPKKKDKSAKSKKASKKDKPDKDKKSKKKGKESKKKK